MLDNLRHDTRRLTAIKSKPPPWYVLESLLFENGYQGVLLHRLAYWFRRHRWPLLGPLIARLSLMLTGIDISPTAEIGPGLLIVHGVGTVVGGSVRIGAGATLMHRVTLAAAGAARAGEMPVVGNHVFIGAGACLIGDITIGDNVFIGAGTPVTEDVPADSKVVCATPPTVRIRRRRDRETVADGPRSRPDAEPSTPQVSSAPPAPRRRR